LRSRAARATGAGPPVATCAMLSPLLSPCSRKQARAALRARLQRCSSSTCALRRRGHSRSRACMRAHTRTPGHALQEVACVSFLSDLAQDTIAAGLSKEATYRSFCEPPTADLLRGLPVGAGGRSFRSCPAVVAARVACLHDFRRALCASDPGGCTLSRSACESRAAPLPDSLCGGSGGVFRDHDAGAPPAHTHACAPRPAFASVCMRSATSVHRRVHVRLG
jgi:hypothetical protein